jgi:hypothetical protein
MKSVFLYLFRALGASFDAAASIFTAKSDGVGGGDGGSLLVKIHTFHDSSRIYISPGCTRRIFLKYSSIFFTQFVTRKPKSVLRASSVVSGRLLWSLAACCALIGRRFDTKN